MPRKAKQSLIDRWHEEDSDDYTIINDLIVEDPKFRWAEQYSIEYLSSGQSSTAFEVGDRIVKVSQSRYDCLIASRVQRVSRGRAGATDPGWAKVYDVITVGKTKASHIAPVCVVVQEKAKVADDLPQLDYWKARQVSQRLEDFILTGRDLEVVLDGLTPRQERWFGNLLYGLTVYKDLGGVFDGHTGNFGLNKNDEAVWIDFGVMSE